jgi:hypothetical protein
MEPAQATWRAAILIGAALALCACAPVAVTALGVGASAGVSHTRAGIPYRTFTAPVITVKSATLVAFQQMGIKAGSSGKVQGNEVVNGSTASRVIEVTLEPLTSKSTRMRVIARDGLFYDGATAVEIILQTQKALAGPKPASGA